MIYRNDPYLDAQFQKAVRAAHDQDWDAFERFSFYDAKMMEDLLYVCEDFMPLEAKCRFALEHYDNHGDTLPSSESMSAVQGSSVPKTGATLYRKA